MSGKAKAPQGRKSTFNDKDAAEIVTRLSKGEPLTRICADEWLPCDDTVRNWAEANDGFARDIARAREAGFDAIALECLTIADSPNATVNTETGAPEVRDAARDRLRVETRLKLLAKWDPKRYGERLDLNNNIGVQDSLAELMKAIDGKSRGLPG